MTEIRRRWALLFSSNKVSGPPIMERAVNNEEAWQAAREWCDAWNRRDIEGIMHHYADDVEFSSPTVVKRWGIADGWLRGKDKVKDNFAVGVQSKDLRFELLDVLFGVNAMCVVYRRETGALVTDLVELDENGKGRRVIACYGTLQSE
jgi:ketosteroid isomerase-like protein